ncbi:hypothetical protein T4B_6340 [Trichinella pseudospiralis]|uniref:Uncharacterized protein n=1 Tax=Trichinella pseudospiralis TaxID=6337 RepID=A0A0V1J1L6_TRIPS|nr:hypothetical protein T4A_8427 [Trichinella pseudospiralis]KRZ08691.1 hypothetical protein T4B_6340 [Trichinella pseudospiralis]KRZ28850.1 hypothetical protein T4C_2573 [Trichinella pseudospiralis]
MHLPPPSSTGMLPDKIHPNGEITASVHHFPFVLSEKCLPDSVRVGVPSSLLMGSRLPLLFSGRRMLRWDNCLRLRRYPLGKSSHNAASHTCYAFLLASTALIVPLYLSAATIPPDPS